MVAFLILDVTNDLVQLRMAVGECAKAFLPIESTAYPTVVVDELGRTCFDISDQIGKCDVGL